MLRYVKDFFQRVKIRRTKRWWEKQGFCYLDESNGLYASKVSIREICKVFGQPIYYTRIKNSILREVSQDPKKAGYVLIAARDVNNLYFTHEGVRAFKHIFNALFDENVIKCLYLNMQLFDLKRQQLCECEAAIRAATKEELDHLKRMDSVRRCPEVMRMVEAELMTRRNA